MDYLQLARTLREKVGAAGEGPSSTLGQRGEYARLVHWIDEAWIEIQTLYSDWFFMHKQATAHLIIGKQSYTGADLILPNFSAFDLADIKLSDIGLIDEHYLKVLPYDVFKRRYTVGILQQTRPIYVSESSSGALSFFPVPDKAYTLNADYFEAPLHLVNTTDTPSLPEPFHMAIVYLAMQYYGRFENAPEVVSEGSYQYQGMLNHMVQRQLPNIEPAASFA